MIRRYKKNPEYKIPLGWLFEAAIIAVFIIGIIVAIL